MIYFPPPIISIGLVLCALACAPTLSACCTTLIAGRLATVDGSVMATHSDDGGAGADSRLLLTAAANHPSGSLRPVYYDREDFPHDPAPGQLPIGHIPEAPHTFARYSCTYGVLNERQVGIGETTCSAVLAPRLWAMVGTHSSRWTPFRGSHLRDVPQLGAPLVLWAR